jgi:hypothetical protein
MAIMVFGRHEELYRRELHITCAGQSSPQRVLLPKKWSFDLLSSLLVSLASYPRELWSSVHHYGSVSVCGVSSSLANATDMNVAHAHHAWDTYKRKGGGKAAAQYALGSTGMSLR